MTATRTPMAHHCLRPDRDGHGFSHVMLRLRSFVMFHGHSLLVMCDTFSNFFRTESMREDVCCISSPKSPSILGDNSVIFKVIW